MNALRHLTRCVFAIGCALLLLALLGALLAPRG